MKAIFDREITSHFRSLTGYIFGAFLLLFTGIYTMVINLKYGYPNFEYVLSNMSFVFIIIVPILTMRVVTEERRQKTDQLLYSLPINMTKIVLGKYLALLVVLIVPMLVMCSYPVILSTFGTVYLKTAYSTIFGFFLLGAALISIGMFISSLTENQAISAGLTFVVILMNYFISTLASYVSASAIGSFVALSVALILLGLIVRLITKNTTVSLATIFLGEGLLFGAYLLWQDSFAGIFTLIMEKISLFERFYVFVDGMFDITAVVFFLSVIAVFLFMTVQSLEKRRWS